MKNTIKTELIEKYLKENGISKTTFCKQCKISLRTLNKIYANNDNFGIIAIFKIARVINIEVCKLFN